MPSCLARLRRLASRTVQTMQSVINRTTAARAYLGQTSFGGDDGGAVSGIIHQLTPDLAMGAGQGQRFHFGGVSPNEFAPDS